MQELELNMQRGLMHEGGGRDSGILRYIYHRLYTLQVYGSHVLRLGDTCSIYLFMNLLLLPTFCCIINILTHSDSTYHSVPGKHPLPGKCPYVPHFNGSL